MTYTIQQGPATFHITASGNAVQFGDFFLSGQFVAFKQLPAYLPTFPPFTLCLFTSNSPGYGKEGSMVKGKTPVFLSPIMEPRKPR